MRITKPVEIQCFYQLEPHRTQEGSGPGLRMRPRFSDVAFLWWVKLATLPFCFVKSEHINIWRFYNWHCSSITQGPPPLYKRVPPLREWDIIVLISLNPWQMPFHIFFSFSSPQKIRPNCRVSCIIRTFYIHKLYSGKCICNSVH